MYVFVYVRARTYKPNIIPAITPKNHKFGIHPFALSAPNSTTNNVTLSMEFYSYSFSLILGHSVVYPKVPSCSMNLQASTNKHPVFCFLSSLPPFIRKPKVQVKKSTTNEHLPRDLWGCCLIFFNSHSERESCFILLPTWGVIGTITMFEF